MGDKIRVVLADDHTFVRRAIRQALESADDIEVLGEASDGNMALLLVRELKPDVALLDIQMPGQSGIEVTRQIKAQFPSIHILVLTAYNEDPFVFASLQAGADGYLLKTLDVDDLIRAVRAVCRGESVLSPEITGMVLKQMKSGRPAGAAKQIEGLTDRELEVLRLVAEGQTNKSIGVQLGINDRTVRGHLANIFSKLGVASRTEAVTEGLKKGWIVLK
ncbi:MAG: response regulator [Anaerolineae bacterium]